MDDFLKDLQRGKQGEAAVITALAARGHIITDVSDIREYQRKDIDLIVSNNGASTTLEIKTDTASENTGNLFIEYTNLNNRSHSYKGWYCYCEADYMCFYQENLKKAHIISRYDLIQTIENNNYKTASSYNACGYLLPITAVKQMKSYLCIDC